MKASMRPQLGGAVYILPNLLTAGNLFFGFYSMIKSIEGDFKWATGAILLAAVFDILDGRVARLTNGTSEFGVQFDSLCDLASFGLAPAIMMHQYALSDLGRVGWISCFIFVACGSLRLARFNVQSSIGKTSGDFMGLPIPMAAGLIACYVGFTDQFDYVEGDLWFINAFYTLLSSAEARRVILVSCCPILGALMVSNVQYRAHKSIKFSFVKPFKLLSLLVAVVAVMAYKPTLTWFLFFAIYAFSGPVEWVLGWKRSMDEDDIFESEDLETSAIDSGSSGREQTREDL